MTMITLRFVGTCCFVDGREMDPFVKRAILPTDLRGADHKDGPHIPYVEIEADDLGKGSTVKASKTFTRGERSAARSFLRFHLDGEQISIRNAGQGNGRLVVIPTFDERVPRMTLVCPECPPNPRPECFVAAPPRDLVAAYFDIRSGYLSAGPIEEEETRFEQGSNWPARRLARWAELDVAFQGDHAEILIEKFDRSGSRTIPLKRGASVVTVGNQMEIDIEENGSSYDRSGHFDMYYDLGVGLPDKRPRPAVAKTAIRNCAPANWP